MVMSEKGRSFVKKTATAAAAAVKESVAEEVANASKDALLKGIEVLPKEQRSDLIDHVLETYCAMCASTLNADGDCPEGCDPDDMLDDDDDDDDDEDDEEGGDDGDPDEDDDEDDATETDS
jgi:hypothetical protein